MNLNLENKVVLVADSCSQNAAACINILKRERAMVVVCLEEGQAEPEGADAVFRSCLSSLNEAEELREAIAGRFGRLDAVIFNQFAVQRTGLLALDAASFMRRLAVARAAFVCCKVFGQYMADLGRGGALAFVTTLHDEKPNGSDFMHSIAQGMIENLVMEAAMEYGTLHVRTNQISVGAMAGTAEQLSGGISSFYDGCMFKAPTCRLATAEDIANLAAFLVSDCSGFINGARVRMDGGLALHYIDAKANYRAHMAQKEGR